MSYWIKTTIPLFIFNITQKDINSRLRGQFTAFYIRMKNKTSTTKNSKGGIIGTYLYIFKMRQTRTIRWWNCINQTYNSKDNFSPQNLLGAEADNKRERAVLIMCLCFLSTTPFCQGVSIYEV